MHRGAAEGDDRTVCVGGEHVNGRQGIRGVDRSAEAGAALASDLVSPVGRGDVKAVPLGAAQIRIRRFRKRQRHCQMLVGLHGERHGVAVDGFSRRGDSDPGIAVERQDCDRAGHDVGS